MWSSSCGCSRRTKSFDLPSEQETIEDRFTYERAAIPCELSEGRPLTAGDRRGQGGDTEACIDRLGGGGISPFADKNVWLSVSADALHAGWLHLFGNMCRPSDLRQQRRRSDGRFSFLLLYLVPVWSSPPTCSPRSTRRCRSSASGRWPVMGPTSCGSPGPVCTVIFPALIPVWLNSRLVLLAFWLISQFFIGNDAGIAWSRTSPVSCLHDRHHRPNRRWVRAQPAGVSTYGEDSLTTRAGSSPDNDAMVDTNVPVSPRSPTTATTSTARRMGRLRPRHLHEHRRRVPLVASTISPCPPMSSRRSFYQDLLEFPLTELFENRDYTGSTHFFFDIGNGNLRLLRLSRTRPRPVRRGARIDHHLAISVTPKQAYFKQKLHDAGVEIVFEHESSIYFNGPMANARTDRRSARRDVRRGRQLNLRSG